MSLTWEGDPVTGPILIYQDELIFDDRTLDDPANDGAGFSVGDVTRQGALVCRSDTPNTRVGWRATTAAFFADVTSRQREINHIRNGATATPSLSRLSRGAAGGSTAVSFIGLLICQVETPLDNTDLIFVGLYRSGGGEFAEAAIL